MCTEKQNVVIDLRSDTVSHPTALMREAMANAIVGDDVYGEDPTVNELQRKCATLFGKEAALFVPSGTMGNLISIMVHCKNRGEEAIVGSLSHVFLYEQGSAASIGGVLLNPIENFPNGTFDLVKFKSKIRGTDCHEPKTRLGIVENTHNICGGKVIPLEWIDEFVKICREHNMLTHMDGARVFYAAEYLKVPVSRIARDFDSLTFCLSKSLCAPIGSIIVGSKKFIEQAHRIRKSLGGGMRQVGILAAAGIVALEEIVPKLGDDHRRMKKIAQSVYELNNPFVKIDIENVHSNILLFEMTNSSKYSADYFAKRLNEVNENEITDGIVDNNGQPIVVKSSTKDLNFIRIVIYNHISDELVDYATKKIVYCVLELV